MSVYEALSMVQAFADALDRLGADGLEIGFDKDGEPTLQSAGKLGKKKKRRSKWLQADGGAPRTCFAVSKIREPIAHGSLMGIRDEADLTQIE
jgi:hypothetical protein